jgi:hypothetical protein
MFIKAFGIALKMTFAGNNQFTHPSTYVFVIIVVGCILTQMNYFNKALSQFSTNMCVPPSFLQSPSNPPANPSSVNPLYYVTFTTFTLIASCLLFQGFNTTSAVNTISLLCGFLIIFSGVYLLNLSRDDPNGSHTLGNALSDGIPSDAISGFPTRRSMQARRSQELYMQSNGSGVRRSQGGEGAGLMHDYDVENQFELGDLADSDDEENRKGKSFDEDGRLGGRASSGSNMRSLRVQRESIQPKRTSSPR